MGLSSWADFDNFKHSICDIYLDPSKVISQNKKVWNEEENKEACLINGEGVRFQGTECQIC